MLSTHPPPPGSTMATRWMVGGRLRDSIVVSISACHVEDPGSIPGRGPGASSPLCPATPHPSTPPPSPPPPHTHISPHRRPPPARLQRVDVYEVPRRWRHRDLLPSRRYTLVLMTKEEDEAGPVWTVILWCSGYHVCLTRRRSPVRNWAGSREAVWQHLRFSKTPLLKRAPSYFLFTFLHSPSSTHHSPLFTLLPRSSSLRPLYSLTTKYESRLEAECALGATTAELPTPRPGIEPGSST
nr:hypothetical transcript [Hymenolepis microstoma]